MKQTFFNVGRMSREDLISQGYKADNLTDEQMERFAQKMGDIFVAEYFWDTLNCLADEMNIPKGE